jgi:hypothetical protein
MCVNASSITIPTNKLILSLNQSYTMSLFSTVVGSTIQMKTITQTNTINRLYYGFLISGVMNNTQFTITNLTISSTLTNCVQYQGS